MIKVIFMATPEISINALDALNKSEDFEVCAVVTQCDKPAGRGNKIQFSPVKKYAIENNIPVFQPKSIRKEPEIQAELKKFNPDYLLTFAFGQILSREVLDIPKIATINLHASLLPKYRGANPIQRCLINGDEETGICTMITEEGLDSGDVCLSEKIQITENMNFKELHDKISELAPDLIIKTLKGLLEKTITPQKQDESLVTFANKLTKEDELIKNDMTALQVHNLVRGIYPCAYFIYNQKRIKVLKTLLEDKNTKHSKFGEARPAFFLPLSSRKCNADCDFQRRDFRLHPLSLSELSAFRPFPEKGRSPLARHISLWFRHLQSESGESDRSPERVPPALHRNISEAPFHKGLETD